MAEQPDVKKLGPLLQRMAELNSEANALSAEIDEHLRGRAASTWPDAAGSGRAGELTG